MPVNYQMILHYYILDGVLTGLYINCFPLAVKVVLAMSNILDVLFNNSRCYVTMEVQVPVCYNSEGLLKI